ncbi:SixA phosphatase family protein [Chitinophagaceae bacterium LWZ2-11]
MKQLIIVRHAKSSWDFSTLDDFDRPLNDRGHKDAPVMAKRLLTKKIAIDAFVSSTAKRAFTTAAYFAEVYGIKEKGILKVPKLYHAEPPVFLDVIKHMDNALNTIAIFSHNPGITEFVNSLTNARIDNMPTCGVFGVKINTDKWSDFENATKDFWFFDYPKLK